MLGALALPDLPTSKSLVVRDAEMLPSTSSPMGNFIASGAADMAANTQSILLEIQQNTAETVELLKTAILGTPTQQRDEGITGGDTDPPAEGGGRFGNALKGIGSALDKVNPFSSNFAFGNIGRALLAGGGLILIKLFGDRLIGPLASLLETIKTGKIGENLTEVKDYLVEKGLDIFEGIKTTTISFIDGVKTVSGLISGAYNAVKDYIMQFDTQGKVIEGGPLKGLVVGDGTLDETELEALGEDIKDKITTFMADLFDGLFTKILPAIGGALLGVTFIGATVRRIMAAPAVAALATSKPLIGPVKGTPLKASPGLMSKMGVTGNMMNIAGLLVYGITTTWMNTSKAYADTLAENNGEFEFKKFLANFLGGEDEGGMLNGLAQAFMVGGTGALAGMSAGAMIGAFGGPIGIIGGGLIGLAIGAVGGGISGYAGSDALEKIADDTTSAIGRAMDNIGNFFSETIEGLGNIAEGGSFSDSDIETAKRKVTDFQERNPYLDLMNMSFEEAVAAVRAEAAAGTFGTNKSNVNRKVKNKINNLKRLYGKSNLSMADETGEKVGSIAILRDSGTQVSSMGENLKNLISEKAYIESLTADQYADEYNISKVKGMHKGARTRAILALEKEIKELSEDLNIAVNYDTKDLKTDTRFGGNMEGVNLINMDSSKTQSDNTQLAQYSLGGMTVSNPDYATEVLVKGIR